MLFILVVGLLAGCSSPPRHQQNPHAYALGTGREQIHATLGDNRLLATATRPDEGWSGRGDFDVARAAAAFEQANPWVTVQACDVYRIERGTSVPFATTLGVYFDFLYFDKENRLLGYDRRFVD